MEIPKVRAHFSLNPKRKVRKNSNYQKKTDPYSGFVIIRLSEQFAYSEGKTLEEVVRKNKLERLAELLKITQPRAVRRVITSVSPAKLKELEAKARSSELPPLNSLSNYWRLDFRNFEKDLDELVRAFQQVDGVELAYRELSVSDPVIDPTDDDLSDEQGYLNPAPEGIDARWAWTQGGEGAGVGFIDLEQGWIPTHEDLAAAGPTLIFNDNRNGVGTYIGDHGTAVLGEVVGTDNDLGIVGIAPSVDYVKMVSHFEAASGTTGHVADAIVAAIAVMNAGDVLLLEIQRNFLPTETDAADFDAIRLAVAYGIVVVEAAGNGGEDLDPILPGDDSGAIMVGASESALAADGISHDRWEFSNFGARIDCYGWGENIATAGYASRGTISLGGDATATMDDDYTGSFGGTSGASPMIVGAALILQGLYKSSTGTVLSPLQMRALLSDPATGTAQGAGTAGNISVMPNLRAIIEDTLSLTPDVYLRDYVGDDGDVPSTGAISASPDIITRPDAVPDPTAAFGEGSGTENSNSQGYTVEFGQDNFLYVRMKNRGASDANGVTATVYWSEVSTLVTPNLWNLIGTSAPVNVPVGDTLVVADPITWPAAGIPAEGHYCFIGMLDHPQDAAPPIPGPTDWDGFYNLIRNHNNVTWRNFNVEDDIDPSDPSAAMAFNIMGAPDKRRIFDIEFVRALPKGAKVWLELPFKLYNLLKLRDVEVKVDKKRRTVMLQLPGLRRIRLHDVLLPRSAKYKCRLLVRGGKGYEKGTHYVAARQIYQQLEVGRVTWALKVKDGQREKNKPQIKVRKKK